MSANDMPIALVPRPLGQTGLLVHPICIGCAPLASAPRAFGYSVSEAEALTFIRAALDSPINFLDTAASYGDGESERRLGLVLRERGGLPLGIVLATKADRALKTGEFTGDQMRRSVERSLRLLGLERLQVCYLHDPQHTTFMNVMSKGGPLEALQNLKEQGLIEHLGVAGGPVDMEIQYIETGAFEIVITHNRYNLLNTEAAPILAAAKRRGVAVINGAPYGSGILAKGPAASPRFMYRTAPPLILERAARIQSICARYSVPMAASALQFALREPTVVSTIVGMTKPDRLTETLTLASLPLPDALWDELTPLIPPPTEKVTALLAP